MLGIGTILSIVGGVSEAVNVYKFGSTLAKGSDAERVLGALDRIHATVERLSDNILYAPGIEGLSPAAGAAHRLNGLREARALLEPVQVALGGEIVSSGLIETPDKMERAMLENPWAMLEDIRPQALAVRHANPDKVPVLFVHNGVRYIGWQMRGALPMLFNCELRDLPGLGASLTPEVWDQPPQIMPKPARKLPEDPLTPTLSPRGEGVRDGGGSVPSPQRGEGQGEGALRKLAATANLPFARPSWASDAGRDKFGVWADFALGGARQRMRWIEPGTFLMGSPNTEPGRWVDEGPLHEVRLTKGFWLGDTPVTQALWTAAMGNNPSHFKDPKCPVECVSWHDAQQFLQKMNARIPGLGLGLPTEAQWEYACRAGTEGANYAGDAGKLEDIAWYWGNSGTWLFNHRTQPVATKRCNDWGLYDMLGNVWEWCADGKRSYTAGPVTNPAGPLVSASRALRGGSWNRLARNARAALRYESDRGFRLHYIGFRCCA
ncbi:MAG: formylglycine-generating enzyme family protein [Rhodomicrobium sp.]